MLSKIYKELLKFNNKRPNIQILKCAKDLNRLPKNRQMANNHLKRCSTSYVIREMQTKTIMRYHYTPVRMLKIYNTDNSKFWWGCGAVGTHTLLAVVQNCYTHFGRQFGNFLKTKHTFVPYDPTVKLLVIYPKDLKTYVHTKACTWILIEALLS